MPLGIATRLPAGLRDVGREQLRCQWWRRMRSSLLVATNRTYRSPRVATYGPASRKAKIGRVGMRIHARRLLLTVNCLQHRETGSRHPGTTATKITDERSRC